MTVKYVYFVNNCRDSYINNAIIECEYYVMVDTNEHFLNFMSLDNQEFLSYNKRFIESYGKRKVTEEEKTKTDLDIPF